MLAIVNGDTITTADLDRELVTVHDKQTSDEREHFDYRKLLDKLVNDRLIIQEATALGMGEEDWLVSLLEDYSTDNAIRFYVGDNFDPDLSIEDEAVLSAFERNYRKLQLRTVSVADSMQAVRLRQAVADGADMDSLARKVSLDVNSIRGGLHNDKYQADVETVLMHNSLDLKVGELSSPFKYRNSFAFLRVERRTPADTADLTKFRPVLEKSLGKSKQRMEWDEFVATLAGKYPVHIDTAAINVVLADSALLFTPDFVKDGNTPVLSVAGDITLTEGQLRTDVSRTAMNMGNQSIRMILAQALNDAEERLTLLAAARDAGYLKDPRVAAMYQHSLDSSLIEVYLKETVVAQIKFNWAEFEEYYNSHLKDFLEDTKYQFDRIHVADSVTAGQVQSRLNDGADFDYLADQYDPNPDRKTESDDWVTLATFPESMRDELQSAEIGQVLSPLRVMDGFLLLRLRDRRPGEPKPIKDVEMRIREVMFQRKFNSMLDKTLGTLKANSDIEYRQSAIDKYFGSES